MSKFIKCYICTKKKTQSNWLHIFIQLNSHSLSWSANCCYFNGIFSFDSLIISLHCCVNIWFALQEHRKKSKNDAMKKPHKNFNVKENTFFICTVFLIFMRCTRSHFLFVLERKKWDWHCDVSSELGLFACANCNQC